MKFFITISFCFCILFSSSFAYQTESNFYQTNSFASNDATSYNDSRISEIKDDLAWNNYLAQITPEEIEDARKGLVKPLPKSKATKRKEVAQAISRIVYQNIEKMNKKPYYDAETITNSVPERPYVEEKSAFMLQDGRIAYHIKRSGVKITRTEKGLEKIEDFDNGTTEVSYCGRVIDPIVDFEGNPTKNQPTSNAASTQTEVTLNYDRFDVNIEENYYNANSADLVQFFDDFEPRFDLLENRTGWSSEKFYGENYKLQIWVTSTPGCWGGYAYSTEAHMYFSDPFDNPSCNFNYSFMKLAIHESLHSINPLPVFIRSWLTEGWSQYEQSNTLVSYGDLTQSEADSSILNAQEPYNWDAYVANNYNDTTSYNYEIQLSKGYDITAWMFTMMRNDHSMEFADLYTLIDENLDTLDKADSMWQTSDYFTDMVVIDLFGRAAGYNFSETKDIWEYDGPSGPGWGVRQWVSTDWYGDVSPVISFSNSEPNPNDNIDILTTIHNYGEVNYVAMPVNVYNGTTLIDSLRIDIPALDSVVIATPFSQPEGTYSISVSVDKYNIKIESDEFNNEATNQITFQCCHGIRGNVDGDVGDKINVSDLVYLVAYSFQSGSAPACADEGDVNGSGSINVSDLVYLVAYSFQSGPAPAACP